MSNIPFETRFSDGLTLEAEYLNNMVDEIENKQEILKSGVTLKTINGNSLLGSGNITVGSGDGGSTPIDTTLSYEGMAADAKVTGDRLTVVEDKVRSILGEDKPLTSTWYDGLYLTSPTAIAMTTTFKSTNEFYSPLNTYILATNNSNKSMRVGMNCYDSDGNLIKNSQSYWYQIVSLGAGASLKVYPSAHAEYPENTVYVRYIYEIVDGASVQVMEYEVLKEGEEVTVSTSEDLANEIANGTSKIIHVKNGEYTLFNAEVYRYLEIIGESRDGVIIKVDGANYPDVPLANRHIIRFQNSGLIKNVTLEAYNVKYQMHQDSFSTQYELIIDNCHFIRTVDAGVTSNNYMHSIGCGCHGYQNITIKNSVFEFVQPDENNPYEAYAVYWHNWYQTKTPATIKMENCSCIGQGLFIVDDLGSKPCNDLVIVSNSYSDVENTIWNRSLGHYLEVPNADVPYNVLWQINCKINKFKCRDRDISKYKYLKPFVNTFE